MSFSPQDSISAKQPTQRHFNFRTAATAFAALSVTTADILFIIPNSRVTSFMVCEILSAVCLSEKSTHDSKFDFSSFPSMKCEVMEQFTLDVKPYVVRHTGDDV